jgi:hypothetical protein
MVTTHFFCGLGRCAYGSAKATLGTAKFYGGMVASLPHACIGTPPWKLGGAGIPPNGGT